MSWFRRWLQGKLEQVHEIAVVAPLDQERITPNNPLYTALITAVRENRPVLVTYNRHTGQIISTHVDG